MNRNKRAQIAEETLELLKREVYSVNANTVSLSEAIAAMRSGTRLYTPAELEALLDSLEPTPKCSTSVSVVNCTTLSAAKALIEQVSNKIINQ